MRTFLSPLTSNGFLMRSRTADMNSSLSGFTREGFAPPDFLTNEFGRDTTSKWTW